MVQWHDVYTQPRIASLETCQRTLKEGLSKLEENTYAAGQAGTSVNVILAIEFQGQAKKLLLISMDLNKKPEPKQKTIKTLKYNPQRFKI